MQAEAGCQRGPHCLTARGPAANSDKGLTYTGLAAFMATDPLHVILGNIIDIYIYLLLLQRLRRMQAEAGCQLGPHCLTVPCGAAKPASVSAQRDTR